MKCGPTSLVGEERPRSFAYEERKEQLVVGCLFLKAMAANYEQEPPKFWKDHKQELTKFGKIMNRILNRL